MGETMAKKDEAHPLESLDLAHRFDWGDCDAALVLEVVATWTSRGYGVRFGMVGYGTALRFTLTDSDANVWGATIGSVPEMTPLFRGLLAAGAEEFVDRHKEPARGRRRR